MREVFLTDEGITCLNCLKPFTPSKDEKHPYYCPTCKTHRSNLRREQV